MSKSVLSERHAHPRDALLRFYEREHKYEVLSDANSSYTSVTTWLSSHFAAFDAPAVIARMMAGRNWNETNKYWAKTPQQIQQEWRQAGAAAAKAGTELHERIELFMNNVFLVRSSRGYTHQDLYDMYMRDDPDACADVDEWGFFLQFVKDFPDWKPYRTEWMIWDEDLKLAGSVDMCYENPDGTLTIYDWKRCKDVDESNDFRKFSTNPVIAHIADTKYGHYCLQLNMYKAILERNYGKQVTQLCLVCLHPDQSSQTYQLVQVPFLTDEIHALCQQRMDTLSTTR